LLLLSLEPVGLQSGVRCAKTSDVWSHRLSFV